MAEKSRSEVFNRRAALLAGGKLVLLAGLGGRLYSLQVLESDRYCMMAEDNRVNLRLLAPGRGYIVDRYGQPLAVNTLNYQLNLRPEQAGDIEATLDALSRVIMISPDERQRVLDKVKKSRRKFLPVMVRQELTWEEVSRIEVNSPDLPGLAIEPEQGRYYPLGEVTTHAVGYVGAVNETEMGEDSDPALELPSYRIGKTGIEITYEKALRGKVGTTAVEVNNLNRVIQELVDRRVEAKSGHDIVLTLDVGLQRFIMDRLADQNAAAAVVMEVNTGEVLALVSTPSYDPNLFTNGIGVADWENIRDNPYKPQTNKAIAGQYAPGSTFKMAVMLAALEAGFGAGFTTTCKGFIEFGDRRFHCWKRWGHGPVNITRSIRQSCDIFYYELSQKVGIERIAKMARRLGLGRLFQHRLHIPQGLRDHIGLVVRGLGAVGAVLRAVACLDREQGAQLHLSRLVKPPVHARRTVHQLQQRLGIKPPHLLQRPVMPDRHVVHVPFPMRIPPVPAPVPAPVRLHGMVAHRGPDVEPAKHAAAMPSNGGPRRPPRFPLPKLYRRTILCPASVVN